MAATAQASAQDALFKVIKQATEEIASAETYDVSDRTGQIRDLAIAYRFISGGQQPGGVEIGK